MTTSEAIMARPTALYRITRARQSWTPVVHV
uniref:Uncharacterized protein n=1 Tax=Arundo donax TaxID=35708 RepID=A0A0A9D348_ARUDO